MNDPDPPASDEPAPPRLRLDHIAIGCETLEQGVEHLRALLGVEIPPGGKHVGRGTHNRVMRIGEDIYLELIAVDPEQEQPEKPRAFALDDAEQQELLHERPRPVGWMARSRDIAVDIALSPIHLGHVTEMRRGDLVWKLSERDEGTVLEHGLLPMLIEWPAGAHPSVRMADLGVRFERLRLMHPEPDFIVEQLEAIGVRYLVDVVPTDEDPHIELDVIAPGGELVTLR